MIPVPNPWAGTKNANENASRLIKHPANLVRLVVVAEPQHHPIQMQDQPDLTAQSFLPIIIVADVITVVDKAVVVDLIVAAVVGKAAETVVAEAVAAHRQHAGKTKKLTKKQYRKKYAKHKRAKDAKGLLEGLK